MAYNGTRRDGIVYSPALHFREEGKLGLGHFFFESCRKYGDRVFQIDGLTGKTETYSSILEKSVRVAMELKKIGIKEGDIISICSTNNMDTILPVYAATYLNVVSAAIDPSLSLRDSVYLLNTVRPKLIFVEASAMDLVEGILKEIDFKMDVVVMGDYKKYIPFSNFLKEKHNEDEFRPVEVNTSDLAVIFFSSGTTGMPKGVRCSHYGLLYGMSGMRQLELIAKVSLHFSSFYWISAYITTMLTVVYGGAKVILPSFDPISTLNAMQEYKITFAFLPSNTAYSFTKENTAGYDTSSLENIIFSGSKLADMQLQKCGEYFPDTLVSAGYGQSEASNFVTIFSKATTASITKQHPSSCGILIPGINAKIVDIETEEILPPNEQGELRIQSGGIFIGYHSQEPDSTIDSEGFLKTGDIAYFNEDNCIYICDRLKDMFKYQYWHIVPASVEKVIYQHPAVHEAIVLGIPHIEDGDRPMALVVLKKDYSHVNEEDIKSFVDANVLDREKLRAGLKIVPAFPKTITGKILRREIRKAVIAGVL